MHANIPVTFIMAALTAILGVVLGIWLMRSHTLEGQASIGVRASAALRAWRVPVTSIAVVVVVGLVLTVAWPVLLQRFRVNPNAQEMESTYIQRNIDATRAAYGLDKLKTEQYKVTDKGEQALWPRRATPPRRFVCSTRRSSAPHSNSCSSPSSTTPSPTLWQSTSTRSTAFPKTP